MKHLKAKLTDDDKIEYFVLGFVKDKDDKTVAICAAKNGYGDYIPEEFDLQNLKFTNLE